MQMSNKKIDKEDIIPWTKPDHGLAWIIMMVSFAAHVINSCYMNCFGVLHLALLEYFDQSVGYTSLVGAIMQCLTSSTGPFGSVLINIFNCVIATIIGGILVTAGCLISGFTQKLWLVMLFLGVIAGLGGGLSYNTSVIVVGLNFEKKRNFASGIAVCGAGIGMFIFPPLLTYVYNLHGYPALMTLLASISLHICVIGALYRPSYYENRKKNVIRKGNEKQIFRTAMSSLNVLRLPSVLLICCSFFSTNFGIYLIVLHLPQYAVVMGSESMSASFLLSIAGISSTISRILTGIIASKLHSRENLLYNCSFGILGVSTILFPFLSSNYAGQVIHSIVLGSLSGNVYSIINSLNVTIAGIENLATVYGFEMFFCGMGILTGPPIAGFMVDSGGSYTNSFWLAGCSITLGCIFGIMASCCNKANSGDSKERDVSIDKDPNSNTVFTTRL